MSKKGLFDLVTLTRKKVTRRENLNSIQYVIMKRNILAGVLVFCVHLGFGQGAQIPRPSPKASVGQNIGVTNVQINYCRPSVRAREIFGKLIKDDKVWRAGANEATIITFDYDLTFGSKPVAAGKYGLFMIPGKDKWVVILNSE
ncbi:MAG: hypothetical protein ACJA2S_003641 [Cyclobacteriaceae bacterium]